MSGRGAAHPSYDIEDGTVPIDALLDSVRGGRVLVIPGEHYTHYVRHHGERYDVAKLNYKGGYCDRRPRSRGTVRRLAEAAVEEDRGLEVADYEDGWPRQCWPEGRR